MRYVNFSPRLKSLTHKWLLLSFLWQSSFSYWDLIPAHVLVSSMRQPLEKFSQNIYFMRSCLHCLYNDFRRINLGKYVYNYRVAFIFRLSKGIFHKHSISESYMAILSSKAFGELWNVSSSEDEDVDFCILFKEDMSKKLNWNNTIHCDSCDRTVHLKCANTAAYFTYPNRKSK